MGIGEILAIALAGLAAGTVNTVVGSGTLITFPVLLAFGYAPVVANVSNTIGLVPGSVMGAVGYRQELRGPGGRDRGAGRRDGHGGRHGGGAPARPAALRLQGDRARLHRGRPGADHRP